MQVCAEEKETNIIFDVSERLAIKWRYDEIRHLTIQNTKNDVRI